MASAPTPIFLLCSNAQFLDLQSYSDSKSVFLSLSLTDTLSDKQGMRLSLPLPRFQPNFLRTKWKSGSAARRWVIFGCANTIMPLTCSLTAITVSTPVSSAIAWVAGMGLGGVCKKKGFNSTLQNFIKEGPDPLTWNSHTSD